MLAGGESLNWHPLLADFILLARKLEKLGFVYHRQNVSVINPTEYELWSVRYVKRAESLVRKSCILLYSVISPVTKRNELEGFVPVL